MDKVFLDTNILLDFLAARVPFNVQANILFQRAELGRIQLYVSVLSVCNIAYILRKILPGRDITAVINDLSTIVTLIPLDAQIISDALQSSFVDFEDGVQHFSAFRYGGITHLITRNSSDFKNSLIPVNTPEEYLLENP
jgi:predicted nucleic acid-binding protein